MGAITSEGFNVTIPPEHQNLLANKGDAEIEEELRLLLQTGHFDMRRLALKLDVPLDHLIRMRDGVFFQANTARARHLIKGIYALVRAKQI